MAGKGRKTKRALSIFNRDCDAEIIELDEEDDMYTLIRCPYCGKATTVGDTVMISGFVGCNNCYWDDKDGLMATVLRLWETDYEAYAKGDFYRDGYKGWRKNEKQGKV